MYTHALNIHTDTSHRTWFSLAWSQKQKSKNPFKVYIFILFRLLILLSSILYSEQASWLNLHTCDRWFGVRECIHICVLCVLMLVSASQIINENRTWFLSIFMILLLYFYCNVDFIVTHMCVSVPRTVRSTSSINLNIVKINRFE